MNHNVERRSRDESSLNTNVNGKHVLTSTLAPRLQPPSRSDNPFATCWTRPGALAFHFADGRSAEHLVTMLAAQDWCGAIIGPHGSGKSTLLETLRPALSAAGCRICKLTLRDGQRHLPELPHGWLGLRGGGETSLQSCAALAASPLLAGSRSAAAIRPLLIIDGYEQLAWLERMRIVLRCRRAGTGLLVTGHAPTSLPTLIEMAPDAALVERLVDELSRRAATAVTRADVVASHARHGSNVRETLFELYDRHEQLRREARTIVTAGA